jgi:hypothetical protein
LPIPTGFLATLHFLDNQRSVKWLTHLFHLAPLKSDIGTSIWRQEGYMAPKPKPARFVFTVGMVLAMALTILTITADRDLAAPSSSAVYYPQLLLLY